uniref:Uncharacterized protein n=1 Tax=Ciona intestinalis TaxID=7719 RepID=H2XXJ9_CIOIN
MKIYQQYLKQPKTHVVLTNYILLFSTFYRVYNVDRVNFE